MGLVFPWDECSGRTVDVVQGHRRALFRTILQIVHAKPIFPTSPLEVGLETYRNLLLAKDPICQNSFPRRRNSIPRSPLHSPGTRTIQPMKLLLGVCSDFLVQLFQLGFRVDSGCRDSCHGCILDDHKDCLGLSAFHGHHAIERSFKAFTRKSIRPITR